MKLMDKAVAAFDKFCKINEVKPTKMKADFFISGYLRGAQSDVLRIFTPDYMDELIDVYEDGSEIKDRLEKIKNGWVVSHEHNSYKVKYIIVYKSSDSRYAMLIIAGDEEETGFFGINECNIVPL